MKTFKVILIATVFLVIAGCSVSSETSEKPIINDTSDTIKRTEDAAEEKAEKKSESPKSDLKPENIDLNKPFEAKALRDAVFADPEGWKDKEVAVIGDYNGVSVSNVKTGKVHSLRIKSSDGKEMFKCSNQGDAPENLSGSGKGKVFKGKILPADQFNPTIRLESCELVQTSNSDLKPENADADKPFDPKELTESVAENESAWKGKEVTVKGKTGGGFNENSDGSFMFYIMNKENQTQIICRGAKKPPKDAASKEYTYKGTVEKVSDGMRNKELTLKPCEVLG